MAKYRESEGAVESVAFLTIFKSLTVKQHAVFALVAEGRSAKEIAWRLGVSDSAVVQRIEAVRSRAGSPPRAELARAYREYLASAAASEPFEEVAPSFKMNDRPDDAGRPDPAPVLASTPHCQLAQAAPEVPFGTIVPRALIGPGSAWNRMAAMVVIAAGLVTIALAGLGVVQTLAAMQADRVFPAR